MCRRAQTEKVNDMGVTRMRRVQAHKKKELEKILKIILYPIAIIVALLFGTNKKKTKRKR
jgi:hypothetical protein